MADKDKHEAEKPAPPPPAAKPADAPARGASDKPVPATGGLAPADYMTEQEKDALKGQGGSAKEPYPTGDPPPPAESTKYSQGIKGVTDQPSAKPGTASGPAGQAPGISDKPPRKETP